MPHLPPPEPGGDKGGDLPDNSDPTHGAFDLSVYYTPRYSYSFSLYCHVSKMSESGSTTASIGRSVLVSLLGHTRPMNLLGGNISTVDVKQSMRALGLFDLGA